MSSYESNSRSAPVCGVKRHRHVTGRTVLKKGECVFFEEDWHLIADTGEDGTVCLAGVGWVSREKLG